MSENIGVWGLCSGYCVLDPPPTVCALLQNQLQLDDQILVILELEVIITKTLKPNLTSAFGNTALAKGLAHVMFGLTDGMTGAGTHTRCSVKYWISDLTFYVK